MLHRQSSYNGVPSIYDLLSDINTLKNLEKDWNEILKQNFTDPKLVKFEKNLNILKLTKIMPTWFFGLSALDQGQGRLRAVAQRMQHGGEAFGVAPVLFG